MSVLWRRGKAALAVLLALGLACNGPDMRVFAEALEPTEQKTYLSAKPTDVDDNATVTVDDIAPKLEASDEEKVSDDAETQDGGQPRKRNRLTLMRMRMEPGTRHRLRAETEPGARNRLRTKVKSETEHCLRTVAELRM